MTKKKRRLERPLMVSAWCSIVDAFQTAAISADSDYKLKHLVELFNLSDNLVSG